MIPIKILCGCGQKYAFEVEPVAGQMPWVVTCPVCGTDGTAAANTAIIRSLPSLPKGAPMPAPVALQIPAPAKSEAPGTPATAVAAPRATTANRKSPPGPADADQAKNEARKKITRGNPPEEVIKHLTSHGFNSVEATVIVQQMLNQRALIVRRNGLGRMLIGTALLFVPLLAYLIYPVVAHKGSVPMKYFAITVLVGLCGAGMVFRGIFMVMARRTEPVRG